MSQFNLLPIRAVEGGPYAGCHTIMPQGICSSPMPPWPQKITLADIESTIASMPEMPPEMVLVCSRPAFDKLMAKLPEAFVVSQLDGISGIRIEVRENLPDDYAEFIDKATLDVLDGRKPFEL